MLPAPLAAEELGRQIDRQVQCLKESLERAKTEKERKEILTTRDRLGNTLLHTAVANGSLATVRQLLALGAPLDEIGAQQKIALHLAVERSSFDIVQELLGWGASLDRVDSGGRTALQIAEARAADANYKKIAALLKTRQVWQAGASGFRFNKVVHLTQEVFPKIEPARGRDKLLFIGETGSGKSTLLNYLSGVQYETGFEDETGRPFARRIAGVEVAETGHSMVSQTLYPQIIRKEGLDFVYCDLAGLLENRGNEERICAASSIQILSRLPGGIKGIVVVLDIPGFTAARGDTFKKTAVALSKMIGSNPRLMESVCFVITKAPPGVRLTARGILGTYINPLLGRLGRGENPEERALVFMLEEIARREDRILIGNIGDERQRKILEEFFITKLRTERAELFNFVHHDQAQRDFNAVLSTIAGRFLETTVSIDQRLPKLVLEAQEQQRALAAGIREIEQAIAAAVVPPPYDPSRLEREIAAKQDAIETNRREGKSRQEKVNINEVVIGRISKELAEIETDERVVLHIENRHLIPRAEEYTTWENVGHPWNVKKTRSRQVPVSCCIDYLPPPGIRGVRFQYRETLAPAGRASIHRNVSHENYSTVFTATGVEIKIQVEFFTTKSELHKEKIAKLKAEMQQLQDENTRMLKEDIALSDGITKLTEEASAGLVQKIMEQERITREREQLLRENEVRQQQLAVKKAEHKESAERERTAVGEIEQLTIELEVNRKLLELVYETSRTLDLGGLPHVARFWEQYDIYRRRPSLPAAAAPPGGPPLVPGFAALALAAPPLAPPARVPAPAAAGAAALRRV